MNKFQKIIKSRIESLIIQSGIAGTPEHNATAGFLRERYLAQFLKTMTPFDVIMASGFLITLEDVMSPQMD